MLRILIKFVLKKSFGTKYHKFYNLALVYYKVVKLELLGQSGVQLQSGYF